MCLLDLFQGMEEMESAIEIACTFLGDVVGRFKCGKMGLPSKEEILYTVYK